MRAQRRVAAGQGGVAGTGGEFRVDLDQPGDGRAAATAGSRSFARRLQQLDRRLAACAGAAGRRRRAGRAGRAATRRPPALRRPSPAPRRGAAPGRGRPPAARRRRPVGQHALAQRDRRRAPRGRRPGRGSPGPACRPASSRSASALQPGVAGGGVAPRAPGPARPPRAGRCRRPGPAATGSPAACFASSVDQRFGQRQPDGRRAGPCCSRAAVRSADGRRPARDAAPAGLGEGVGGLVAQVGLGPLQRRSHSARAFSART